MANSYTRRANQVFIYFFKKEVIYPAPYPIDKYIAKILSKNVWPGPAGGQLCSGHAWMGGCIKEQLFWPGQAANIFAPFFD